MYISLTSPSNSLERSFDLKISALISCLKPVARSAFLCKISLLAFVSNFTTVFPSSIYYPHNQILFFPSNYSSQKCGHLAQLLGSKVSFPNSSAYLATEGAYWSLQEAELSPACIVVPSTAEDVSTTVSIIAGNKGCPFAIKGAGHAPQAGAANIVSGIFEAIAFQPELQAKFRSSLLLRSVLLLILYLKSGILTLSRSGIGRYYRYE